MRFIFRGILYILRKWDVRKKRITYVSQNGCEETQKQTNKEQKIGGCSSLCTGILPKVYFSGQQKNSPSSLSKNNTAFVSSPLFLTACV